MPGIPSSLGGIAVSGASEALAFGLGFALGRVLEPEAVGLSQTAWAAGGAQIRAVDVALAAQVAAEFPSEVVWARGEAAKHGISADNFDKVLAEVLTVPGIAELLTMRRRGTITEAQFTHGLRKTKREPGYDVATAELETERLDPAVVAVSVQRGTMHDPGLLPVGPPSEVGHVPAMPVSELDPLAEAAAAGIDRERLAIMTRNVGLPLAPGELLELLNRGVLVEADVLRGVAEGNLRNEWGPSLLALKRRLLTPHEYAELRLRGWIDDATMHKGASLSGFEPADTDLLHEMLGRPLAVHQVTTGAARGGAFGGTVQGIPLAYLRSLEQGSIRPEWYDLAYANRYTYPSAFVLRSLTQAGELTGDEAHKILLDIGWEPGLAAKVSGLWSGGTAAKADKHVTKAEGELWTTAHRSYIAEESDETVARATLARLQVPATAQAEVLALWTAERALIRKQLTPAQVKKAYKSAVLNPDTGAAWTHDDALGELLGRGYSHADATTYLET